MKCAHKEVNSETTSSARFINVIMKHVRVGASKAVITEGVKVRATKTK